MRMELRKSRYRLYHKHRSVAELCVLKVVTDTILALQAARAAALWLMRPAQRPSAAALLSNNLRIISLNPFAPDVAQQVH
jgi:hypothetical protein